MDPFEFKLMPFLIPPFLVLVIGAIIVTFGEGLLQLGKTELEIGPIEVAAAVVAATAGIFIIGIAAWLLSARVGDDQPSPSSRETVSHRAEH
jgi:hypothetical protein